jgi:hypothetical protein
MSILGKILAILNVFAVLGAVYVLAVNYAKHRTWEYAVFRQDLLIHGLPIDRAERDNQGHLLFEDIGPETQKSLLPSSPVLTQQDEVERVRNDLRGKIQAVNDKKQQIPLYARVLTPLAVSAGQRERLLAYQAHLRNEETIKRLKGLFEEADTEARKPPEKGQRAKPYDEAFRDALTISFTTPPEAPLSRPNDPVEPLVNNYLEILKGAPNTKPGQAFDQAFEKWLDTATAELQTQFDQAFQEALTTAQQGKQSDRPVEERKHAIARLLFNLVDVLPDNPNAAPNLDLVNNPAYKRFLTVVGLQAAIDAVNDEAKILADMAIEAELQRQRERATFTVVYRKGVEQVQDKASEVEANGGLLARKEKQLGAHEEELKKRRLDVKFYTDQLEEARKDTALRLKDLRGMSQALYNLRIELRDSTIKNQELEKEIRALEQQQ